MSKARRTRFRGLVAAAVVPVLLLVLAVLAVPAEAMGDTGRQPVSLSSVSLTSVTTFASAIKAELRSGSAAIERGHVLAALKHLRSVDQASTAAWTVVSGRATPNASGNFSVGFDNGQNVPSGLPDVFGTRVAIVTVLNNGIGFAGSIETLEGTIVTCALDPTMNSAAAFLAAVGSRLTCPDPAASASPATAVTSVWAWGNSVDPAVDNRGLGQLGMTPEAIANFAAAHGLTKVFLSVPWASNQGAIADWLRASVDALHARGIRVDALGGDTGWLAQPELGARWVSDAFRAANFDGVELDIEPWAGVANPDFASITPRMALAFTAIRAAASGHPVGSDLPWWLAARKYGSGTVFDVLVRRLDSVAIIAFADHANGPDGIVQLATPAVKAAVASRVPFTIGVETDTPAISGGSQFTFYDRGAAVLTTETEKVKVAFGQTSGYRGVAVEHLLSWSALLKRG